jgi:hypothetical protein
MLKILLQNWFIVKTVNTLHKETDLKLKLKIKYVSYPMNISEYGENKRSMYSEQRRIRIKISSENFLLTAYFWLVLFLIYSSTINMEAVYLPKRR